MSFLRFFCFPKINLIILKFILFINYFFILIFIITKLCDIEIAKVVRAKERIEEELSAVKNDEKNDKTKKKSEDST